MTGGTRGAGRRRARPALGAGWRRWLALLLLGQVLAGTLVPAVQAAPLFETIFDVLAGDYCAPPEDPDAPRKPHPDHAHCILCVAGVGSAAIATPTTSAVAEPRRRPQAWLRAWHGALRETRLRTAKGCRGPPAGA